MTEVVVLTGKSPVGVQPSRGLERLGPQGPSAPKATGIHRSRARPLRDLGDVESTTKTPPA